MRFFKITKKKCSLKLPFSDKFSVRKPHKWGQWLQIGPDTNSQSRLANVRLILRTGLRIKCSSTHQNGVKLKLLSHQVPAKNIYLVVSLKAVTTRTEVQPSQQLIDYDQYVHTKGQAELVLIHSIVSVSTLNRVTAVFWPLDSTHLVLKRRYMCLRVAVNPPERVFLSRQACDGRLRGSFPRASFGFISSRMPMCHIC